MRMKKSPDMAITYPLSTPKTRLSTKNEPMIIKLIKYIHGQPLPSASLIWKHKKQSPLSISTSTTVSVQLKVTSMVGEFCSVSLIGVFPVTPPFWPALITVNERRVFGTFSQRWRSIFPPASPLSLTISLWVISSRLTANLGDIPNFSF